MMHHRKPHMAMVNDALQKWRPHPRLWARHWRGIYKPKPQQFVPQRAQLLPTSIEVSLHSSGRWWSWVLIFLQLESFIRPLINVSRLVHHYRPLLLTFPSSFAMKFTISIQIFATLALISTAVLAAPVQVSAVPRVCTPRLCPWRTAEFDVCSNCGNQCAVTDDDSRHFFQSTAIQIFPDSFHFQTDVQYFTCGLYATSLLFDFMEKKKKKLYISLSCISTPGFVYYPPTLPNGLFRFVNPVYVKLVCDYCL